MAIALRAAFASACSGGLTSMFLGFDCCRGMRLRAHQRAFRSPFGNLRCRYFWGYLRLVYAKT